MLVFVVLLLVPILIQHVSLSGGNADYRKKNTVAITFFFLFLTFLVAFRHESVGNDTRNYISFFNRYSYMDWGSIVKESLELGFIYFNKIVSLFAKDAHFFQAITAIITSVLIYPTYKRLCVDASLTIMLYCTMSTFVLMFSGIRQMLAVGIGFIAYEFTRNKKIIPFILVVILAILFHMSAFMLAFMYPLYHVKITKKWLYAIIPGFVLAFVFNKQIFTVIGLLLERYTKYDASIVRTGAYTMLMLFSLFAIFAFLIPEESLLDEETISMRNFLLFALGIQMFAPLHTIAMRMNYYYIIFIPLLIPKIISSRSKRWKQIAVLGRHVMLVFFFVYFFISAKDGVLHVFPYYFFWETI